MGAKYKYCIDGSELVIKDLPAVADTYQDGEILKAAAVNEGGVGSMGVGTGSFVGVSNQGETLPAASGLSGPGYVLGNDGATLAGTQVAGTLDTLKVIINPGAIYAIPYDMSSPITWSANADTSIQFVGVADDFGGGWAYSTDTGELDYVVTSNEAAGTTTLTVVTGNNTASAEGILIQQGGTGLAQKVVLTTDALSIAAGTLDIDTPVAGTGAINLVILENRIESYTHGSEILRPKQKQPGGVANQSIRVPLVKPDLAKAFAYAKIVGNVWNA